MEGFTLDRPSEDGMMGLMVMTQSCAIISMKKSSKPITFCFEKKEFAPPVPSYPQVYIKVNRHLKQEALKRNS